VAAQLPLGTGTVEHDAHAPSQRPTGGDPTDTASPFSLRTSSVIAGGGTRVHHRRRWSSRRQARCPASSSCDRTAGSCEAAFALEGEIDEMPAWASLRNGRRGAAAAHLRSCAASSAWPSAGGLPSVRPSALI
jgi:hypothetical protein